MEIVLRQLWGKEGTQKRGETSQCCPGAEGNMLNMSSDSSSSTRAIFLKLMLNLSVVLLSTCKDGSVFLDDEKEILESVIQNLSEASSKRNKVSSRNHPTMFFTMHLHWHIAYLVFRISVCRH
jgi:hypothetical protein